jgi:hypothetical protein
MRKHISAREPKHVALPVPETYAGELLIVLNASVEEYHHSGGPLNQLFVR